MTDCISSLVTALLSASLVTRNSCCCQRVEKIQDRAEKIRSMENQRWKVALGFLPILLIFYLKTASNGRFSMCYLRVLYGIQASDAAKLLFED